jgi:Mce-associated membrane protein
VTSGARWLTALVAVLLVVALVGAALVVRARHDRADAQLEHERYGAVAAGATGDFRDHYDSRAAQVGRALQGAAPVRSRVLADHTTTTTKVAGSGVVRATPDEVPALVFLDQRVESAGSPATYTARRALVTMVRGDRGRLVDNVQTG